MRKNNITVFFLQVMILMYAAIAFGNIVVLQDDTVVGIHGDIDFVTFQAYPDANIMKKIKDTIPVKIGDRDPTLTYENALAGVELPDSTVYVVVEPSVTSLCRTCIGAKVTLHGEIRTSKTAVYDILPINSQWFIKLHNENGTTITFLVAVNNGVFEGAVTGMQFPESGKWYLSDADFYNVMLPQNLAVFRTYTAIPSAEPIMPYTVKLVSPFELMVYEMVQ